MIWTSCDYFSEGSHGNGYLCQKKKTFISWQIQGVSPSILGVIIFRVLLSADSRKEPLFRCFVRFAQMYVKVSSYGVNNGSFCYRK